MKPLMDQVRDVLSPSATQLGQGAIVKFARNSYQKRLIFVAFANPPSEWRLCGKCSGKDTDRVGSFACGLCDGVGFFVTHAGDFEEKETES
jgi:hypothetical protein